MCIYIGSEVVLANILAKRKKATLNDIKRYCQNLREYLLSQYQIDNVYININSEKLEDALLKYNREFRRFGRDYYINRELVLRHFNSRFGDERIVKALEKVAEIL